MSRSQLEIVAVIVLAISTAEEELTQNVRVFALVGFVYVTWCVRQWYTVSGYVFYSPTCILL